MSGGRAGLRWLSPDISGPSTQPRCGLGDQIIGTLNLFGPTPTDSSEQDLLIIRALADVATITILQQRNVSRAAALNTQLQTALASRIAVEQAKGVLSESLGVDMDEAFAILRHNSRSTNTKLTVLAGYLASGRIKAAELQRPGPVDQRPAAPAAILNRSSRDDGAN